MNSTMPGFLVKFVNCCSYYCQAHWRVVQWKDAHSDEEGVHLAWVLVAPVGFSDELALKEHSSNHAGEGIDLASDENESVQTTRTCYRADRGVQLDGTIMIDNHSALTTLPGLRFERRHVDVSVVQQLKHLRRTRSLSLVVASSVCMTGTGT